jgi:hypothetical protein
VPH